MDAISPRNLEIRGEKAQKQAQVSCCSREYKQSKSTCNFDHVCPQVSYTSGILQYG